MTDLQKMFDDSDARKFVKHSEVHCARLSAAHKGHYHTEETKAKLKKIRKDIPQEWRDNISKALRGKMPTCKRVVTPDGVFNSIRDASDYYKVHPSTIGYWTKKKSGYYFEECQK